MADTGGQPDVYDLLDQQCYGVYMAKKYPMKKDDAYDKKKGIKPGSKKDRALDRKRGVKEPKGR